MPNCRECPKKIRARCIEESTTSSSVKLMMHRAFELGTDTEDLWGLLRADCLLERMERRAITSRPSALQQRLKKKGEPQAAQESEKTVPHSLPTEPVTTQEPIRKPLAARPLKSQKKHSTPSRYCLTLRGDQYRVALPEDGTLVLGRFDPAINVTPDVDLSYNDRDERVISRRHARITGRNGRHEIEDLGSTNGTRVNGKKLGIGQKIRLKSGDRVTIGYCKFTYAPLPEMPDSLHATSPQAYFRVASTGHRLILPAWGKGIIGRSDDSLSFVPDIDLSQEGDAARAVARRHARLVIRKGRHYVEDLGSSSGTKLNGERLRLGELSMLNPGDHLWLGGCVLSYDVEPVSAVQNKVSKRG